MFNLLYVRISPGLWPVPTEVSDCMDIQAKTTPSDDSREPLAPEYESPRIITHSAAELQAGIPAVNACDSFVDVPPLD